MEQQARVEQGTTCQDRAKKVYAGQVKGYICPSRRSTGRLQNPGSDRYRDTNVGNPGNIQDCCQIDYASCCLPDGFDRLPNYNNAKFPNNPAVEAAGFKWVGWSGAGAIKRSGYWNGGGPPNS